MFNPRQKTLTRFNFVNYEKKNIHKKAKTIRFKNKHQNKKLQKISKSMVLIRFNKNKNIIFILSNFD